MHKPCHSFYVVGVNHSSTSVSYLLYLLMNSRVLNFLLFLTLTTCLQQPQFHVIVHKLTEDIDRKESVEKISALKSYLEYYPKTVIVDSLDAVRKVISRRRCCESLENIIERLKSDCPFSQPDFFIIESEDDSSPSNVLQLMKQRGIGFPVMCKPVEACGTPNSHKMVSSKMFFCFILHMCVSSGVCKQWCVSSPIKLEEPRAIHVKKHTKGAFFLHTPDELRTQRNHHDSFFPSQPCLDNPLFYDQPATLICILNYFYDVFQ